MTPQEFRLMRGHLGLTTQWVGEQLGVSHVSVVHWEAGRVALPTYAVDAMGKWLQDARNQAAIAAEFGILTVPADLVTWQACAPAALRHYPLGWAHRVAARAVEQRWLNNVSTTEQATSGAAGYEACDGDE